MIRLSNGHSLEYVTASGALGFGSYGGWGWFWERPLVWVGIMKPELTTITTKSLALHPRKGYLRWSHPWTCFRFIKDGAVNKIGLTNPGIKWWCEKVAPKMDFEKYAVVVSLYGTTVELVEMAKMLNKYNIKAIEINDSCPNSGCELDTAQSAIRSGKAVKEVSQHPIIMKLSADQDYLTIVAGLYGVVEAISLNSVKWETVYPEVRTPLWKLENKVGGGGGGVSGKPAQECNWRVVKEIAEQDLIPVIAPSVMEFEDLAYVRELGAKAISFGTIYLRRPWWPTQFIQRERGANPLCF